MVYDTQSSLLDRVNTVSDEPAEVVVQGSIERVTFENESSGFRVLKLSQEPSGQLLTVVGTMQRLAVGSRVRIFGRWEEDPRHGMQLRARSALVIAPDTREGLERYLGSGLISGIGPVFARRIVEHFGDNTVHVLDCEPHLIAQVPGLGVRRAQSVAQAWKENSQLHAIMVFLQGHGVSSSLALRVFRRFGADSIRVVSEDPYRLAVDIWGVGFRKADEIARSLQIAKDAPARLKAAVLYALHQAENHGHVFLPLHELTQ